MTEDSNTELTSSDNSTTLHSSYLSKRRDWARPHSHGCDHHCHGCHCCGCFHMHYYPWYHNHYSGPYWVTNAQQPLSFEGTIYSSGSSMSSAAAGSPTVLNVSY